MPLAQTRHLLRITRVLLKHGLNEMVAELHLFGPAKWLAGALPSGRRDEPIGVRIREAMEELGPVFVKFGQMLSTRPDLLPDDIARELSKLQDQVPPFAGEKAVDIVEAAYGQPIHDIFAEFNPVPHASASVAQVHFATLHDGSEVAVKVLRPDITPVIERDVALLQLIAQLAEKYWSEGKRLHPVEVVDEYRKTIMDELDLQREAANASKLRANFEGSPLLYVPRVYWDFTHRDVMVLERIHGTPVNQIDTLVKKGIDLKTLAHHGVEIFYTQAFYHSYFHADMHPGNIFVSDEGQYIAVDFGIMGTLGESDKQYLAENFIAFFNRDYRAVARAHIHAGWTPPDTPIEEFEAAIRTISEPIFAKPLKDISFGRFLVDLFRTARRFNMEIQPQLVLLQKTVLNIEGLGRMIYPDLDLWETAKPFLEKWMKQQRGPARLIEGVKEHGPDWFHMAPQMPGLIHDVLQSAQTGKLKLQWESEQLERLRRESAQNQRRLRLTIAGSGLIVASALLGLNDSLAGWRGYPVAGWITGILGLALWARALLQR